MMERTTIFMYGKSLNHVLFRTYFTEPEDGLIFVSILLKAGFRVIVYTGDWCKLRDGYAIEIYEKDGKLDYTSINIHSNFEADKRPIASIICTGNCLKCFLDLIKPEMNSPTRW